jgi:hypothetical protein
MDISTLADLKAEVARKRNEVKTIKAHGRDKSGSKSTQKLEPIWAKKKKPDPPKSGRVDPEEERRVQSALELKARLYNQMKSGQVTQLIHLNSTCK